MSAEAARIVPAIGVALEHGDLFAVRTLMAMLARENPEHAERIRAAVIDGVAAAEEGQ